MIPFVSEVLDCDCKLDTELLDFISQKGKVSEWKYYKSIFPLSQALAVLLLVGAAAAQYNYKAPEPPKNTYLPPTTQKPYQSDAQVAAEGLGPDVSFF